MELMEMGARWYDPTVGRWLSPDTIIPDPTNPQSLNRYSYVYNNALRYTDPTGHFCYDSSSNEFSEGDCYDDMQQQMADAFIKQWSSGNYTDLELAENLIKHGLRLNDDPIIALRAAAEIVRSNAQVPGSWGFEYKKSQFHYSEHSDYADYQFNDSGFGDLSEPDLSHANQVTHFIGIAYIAAYQRREATGKLRVDKLLVWGNELGKGQTTEKNIIEYALGFIAGDLGAGLVISYDEMTKMTPNDQLQPKDWYSNYVVPRRINKAIDAIVSYEFPSLANSYINRYAP